MKFSISMLKTSVALVALVAFATFAQGQNRERFGISAKAGGVNAVTGKVSVKSNGQPSRLLSGQDDLASGDIVATSLGSQVEVLLNPGTYLRLAEKSEFTMVDNSLDNLLVRINKGTAIIEATGPDQIQLHVPIVTEQQRMTIVRAGVYRINVTPGTTELFVRKGRVSLGADKSDLVKGGKKVTFTSAGQTVAKLTSSDKDEFDDWSRTRGQTLARANQRLSARTVSGYLSSGSWSFADARFSRWGIWTWSPFASCYTFLPFYYGWGSPYGNYYGNYAGFGGGGYYGYGNNQPVITGNSAPGGSGSGSGYPGGGSSGGSGGSSGGGRGISSPPPPSTPSQAGPRDADSGSRMINTIKPPIN
ncbi:MAG TPA: FecR domain-containing protein [Pyrinomonadaceae bacterium]